jgi:hypothetical protein
VPRVGAGAKDSRRIASTARNSPGFPRGTTGRIRCPIARARAPAPPARLRTRAVPFVRQPNLRLGDIWRNLADYARRVLVEDVRADTGMLQPVQQQIGVESIQRRVEAFHRLFSPTTRTIRSAERLASSLTAAQEPTPTS